MDQKIVASFVSPVVKYWDSEFGRTLKLASSTTRPASFRGSDVVVTLLVNGDLNGEVHYVVDENTMQAVHSSIVGKWPGEIDDAVTSTFVGIVKKLAAAGSKRLSRAGYSVKVRVVGATISKGELMGPADVIGQLEHLYAERPGSATDEDHVRIWVGARESGASQGKERTGAHIELLEESEPEPEFEEPAADPGVPEVVQARRFELVDGEGHTRAVLGTLGNGSPHLVLSDARGRMRAAIALSKAGAPRIMFFDEVGERIYEEPTLVYKRKAA